MSTTLNLPVDGSSAVSLPIFVALQFEGIAGGGTYKIQASLDGGTTWTDVTKSFIDLSTGALFSGDIAASTVAITQVQVPGLLRILNTHTGTGSPVLIVGDGKL